MAEKRMTMKKGYVRDEVENRLDSLSLQARWYNQEEEKKGYLTNNTHRMSLDVSASCCSLF